ncbi:hypothetical protein VroAM7_50070 (plasmid) [Vibrio rotiferianus]|uniref:Uncharacterized protein n=1 Tax=Vibrio rotiferianus TaxID=190895 RepID=A0A510IEY8_9VIBR|nr:hypothetical protein VroAM7_50070 [Vibrio rotiferianus]
MEIESATRRLSSWLSTGKEFNLTTGLPKHPEFLFRISGEWKGWNNFLNISNNHPCYKSNIDQDVIDNLAWQIYRSRYAP